MTYIYPGYNAHLEDMHATEEDYKFGAVSKLPEVILCPDRQWEAPKFEPQSNSILDTFNCTGFGICNAVEMLHKKRYEEEVDFSDRFVAVTSGTVPGQGNSHKNVGEAVRKCGLVKEEVLPFSEVMTQQEYFSPIEQKILDLGVQWVTTHKFGYEKVDRKDFWDVLTLSPIQIAVDSRTNRTSEFRQYDHSIVIRGGVYGKQLETTDNYLGRNLVYDWDYQFGFAQRYHYEVIQEVVVNRETLGTLFSPIINWLKSLGLTVVII